MRDRLAIGRVQRSHGTRGHLRMQSYSGETGHLAGLAEVFLEPGLDPVPVEEVQAVSGAVLLKLRGVDDREAADRLRGAVVWAAREAATPLGAGEFYAGDLCGCEVRRGDRVVGTVRSVVEGGATALLEVASEGAESFFVPFVDEYVGEVAVERRVVELREGFELP